MEKIKTFLDELKCQIPISFEYSTRRLFVKLFRTRLLYGQELNYFVMVWIELVSLPKHLISFIYLVYAPKKLSF